MNNANTPWTPVLVDRLRQLWPNHSASEVSRLFTADGYAISRGAVIGKCQRLGFSTKLFIAVSREEQRRKKHISDARYKAKQRVVLGLPPQRPKHIGPMTKSEMYAMLAQAVRNTISAQQT